MGKGRMKFSVVLRDASSTISLLHRINTLNDPAKPADLVHISMKYPAIAPLQISSEFLELAELVNTHNCGCILEIGTFRGGTLFVLSRLADADATIISVDYHFSLRGKFWRIFQNPLFHRLIRRGQHLFLLRRNSHKPDTLAKILEILKGRKLDLLFIDGDHSYEGVRKDFEMYMPLVRSGGLVAFHDIAQATPGIEVIKLWKEIKDSYKHTEFVDRTDNDTMGIGVLWV
jgi:predicted O-methyltransferase YrrM